MGRSGSRSRGCALPGRALLSSVWTSGPMSWSCAGPMMAPWARCSARAARGFIITRLQTSAAVAKPQAERSAAESYVAAVRGMSGALRGTRRRAARPSRRHRARARRRGPLRVRGPGRSTRFVFGLAADRCDAVMPGLGRWRRGIPLAAPAGGSTWPHDRARAGERAGRTVQNPPGRESRGGAGRAGPWGGPPGRERTRGPDGRLTAGRMNVHVSSRPAGSAATAAARPRPVGWGPTTSKRSGTSVGHAGVDVVAVVGIRVNR